MKGDVIIVEEHHISVATHIVDLVFDKIENSDTVFTISIAGESGGGKSETGKAIADRLLAMGIKSLLLCQDDYFVLPPKSNYAKRREDPEWLGPHVEVKMDILEKNLVEAKRGESIISKPLIDYDANAVFEKKVSLKGVEVIIVEGTYTSLLKNIDVRIFIDRTSHDTREHRRKRNRGDEYNDPFIETILEKEHKIIAGHKQLSDIIITNEFKVIVSSLGQVLM